MLHDGGRFSLQTHAKKYLGIEDAGGSEVIGESKSINQAEVFTAIFAAANKVVIHAIIACTLFVHILLILFVRLDRNILALKRKLTEVLTFILMLLMKVASFSHLICLLW